MAKSSSASGAGRLLAKRYAVALVDVAQAAGALPSVENNIISLENILNSHPELATALASPIFAAQSQLSVLQDLAKRHSYHPLVVNFMGVLAANRRLNSLPAIILAFTSEIARRAGIVEAVVRSAAPLSASQEESLSRNLSSTTGKNVRLHVSVDPSLIGGMVVTVGSTMVDDSIQSKLNRLGHEMSQTKAA